MEETEIGFKCRSKYADIPIVWCEDIRFVPNGNNYQDQNSLNATNVSRIDKNSLHTGPRVLRCSSNPRFSICSSISAYANPGSSWSNLCINFPFCSNSSVARTSGKTYTHTIIHIDDFSTKPFLVQGPTRLSAFSRPSIHAYLSCSPGSQSSIQSSEIQARIYYRDIPRITFLCSGICETHWWFRERDFIITFHRCEPNQDGTFRCSTYNRLWAFRHNPSVDTSRHS